MVVLDYQGAPYLRFTPGGVEVNTASAMYYLNQVPAQTPPAADRRPGHAALVPRELRARLRLA